MNGLPCIALIFDHGLDEWALLAALVFILFGPKRIPDMARTIGRTLAQLRRAADAFKDELAHLDEEVFTEAPPPAGAPGRGSIPATTAHEDAAGPAPAHALPPPGHVPAGAASATEPASKMPGSPPTTP